MENNKDILLDSNGDLLIQNGDFVIGPSNDQHAEEVLLCEKGEIRNNPSLGVGAQNYLKSRVTQQEFKRTVRVELNRDGFIDSTVKVDKNLSQLKIEVK